MRNSKLVKIVLPVLLTTSCINGGEKNEIKNLQPDKSHQKDNYQIIISYK